MRFGVLAIALLSGFTALGIPAQSPPAESRSTTITGVVFDSLEMRGLPDAMVQISGTGGQSFTRSATTDTAGRFTFSEVPVGTFLLGFFHPKLDALSLTSPTLRVDVRTDQPVQARLAVPSPQTIVRSCAGPKRSPIRPACCSARSAVRTIQCRVRTGP